jgi:hypothetical protein
VILASRRAQALAAAALIAAAGVAFFATPRAVMLVLLAGWHSTLILLPMAAAVLGGLRAGVRDVTLLMLCALTGGGLVAYGLFWIWWMSPTAGAIASIAATAAAAAAIAWLVARLDRATMSHATPLGVAALVWIAYAVFVLAFGMAPSGFQSPLGSMAQRFVELPGDNLLPWIFAQQIAAEHVQSPMAGGWLSSDRPPLQTAYLLASIVPFLPRAEVHAQVQASLLQALWVPGTWILLASFGLARGAVFLALAAGMFSGFAFTHVLFTWPKLLPVAYVAVTAAVLFNAPRETLSDPRVGATVGAALALAMLTHAGSVFIILGLGLVLLALRRVPGLQSLTATAVAGIVIMLPWMLYQALVDPPGNRLAKWFLAGVVEVDSRPLGQSVREAYAALAPGEFMRNKAQNVEAMIGPADYPALVWKASTTGLDDPGAETLRHRQFLHFIAALGMLALAPLAWLAPRAWRAREFKASLCLFAVCLVTIIPWVLVIFVPRGTVIHTGSLAVVCFLFASAMLAFYAASRWLAIAAMALHAALTLDVYGRAKPLAAGASLADYHGFLAIAGVALVVTCALLWKLPNLPDRSIVRP